MFARSTTLQAHQDKIDTGIAHVRDEVMPALQDMDGFVGLSMLIDRSSGRCIVTTSWESEEAMRATTESVRSMRDRAAEMLGGNRAQVDEWEIAALHRDHKSQEGACVRATWMRVGDTEPDRATDVFRMALLPKIEQLPGFCSASLLLDRESGIAVSSVTYDSRAAMEDSRAQADQLRSSGAKEAGVEVLEVTEFDLAIAHLRVPEMA
ncbi:antibiotic biosynthesis monooxygenase [Actinokineospora sp. HUAS TT18]|uniref:antibiotic biosynthesis monooxygenase n=1 Tax=Actinokineospora sp. HUAS TT18 TaxID=3447451 RepID=UPI003F520141